jgi:hypothetical protein
MIGGKKMLWAAGPTAKFGLPTTFLSSPSWSHFTPEEKQMDTPRKDLSESDSRLATLHEKIRTLEKVSAFFATL